jgi:hypothetical protein
VDSFCHVPLPPALSELSRAELEALFVELFGKVIDLEKFVGEQRKEIARLNGLNGRLDVKPRKLSGMDNANEPPKPGNKGLRRFRRKVAPRVKVEDQLVKAAVPEGSRCKGYEPFLVQDLEDVPERIATLRVPTRRQMGLQRSNEAAS